MARVRDWLIDRWITWQLKRGIFTDPTTIRRQRLKGAWIDWP